MAKDAPESARKEKKEKKVSKHSDDAGVKKEKKEKKDKKSRKSTGGDEDISMAEPTTDDMDVDSKTVAVKGAQEATPNMLGALVPFANPLADEKTTKKVLKGVRKGIKQFRVRSVCRFSLTPPLSREEQNPQARRQGSREVAPQITHKRYPRFTSRSRRPCRRYLADGCHLPHPRSLRRSQRSLRLCYEPCGARCSR